MGISTTELLLVIALVIVTFLAALPAIQRMLDHA
jgi:hypothetical protein